MIIYSAFADAGLAVRAAIAGAEGVLPKATAPRALLDALRDGAPVRSTPARCGRSASGWTRTTCRSSACSPTASPRREIAATLGLEPELARGAPLGDARRASSGARRSPAGRRVARPATIRRMPTRDQILEALKVVIDPELHRSSSSSGWSAPLTSPSLGPSTSTVSLTTPGCPIKGHFQTGVDQGGAAPSKASPRVSVGFDVLSDQEKAGLQKTLGRPQRAARGRARAGRQRRLHRLRQGRRGQVDADRQPRRGAAGRGQDGRRARRRRLGLLDPAHARARRPAPEGLAREEDPPARGARPEGHLDRLLPQGGRGGRVARPDAAQGAHAVPRGRRVGRARLPADRPAAGHRRRLDDALAAAAAGDVHDRHDAAGRRPEGRAPRGADGRQGQPRDLERDREHVRLHHAGRRALPDLRRGRRPAPGRRARRAAAWARSR